MLLNGFALNSAALNGAAFLAIAFVEVTSAVAGASAIPNATKTQFAEFVVNAAVNVTLTGNQTVVARSENISYSLGEVAGALVSYSAASANASSISYIAANNVFSGTFNVPAVATGYAIPANKLGDFSVSATALGGFTATRIQHLKVNAFSYSIGSFTADRIRYVLFGVSARANGYADWQFKASGTTTWLFDGHARFNASAIDVIDETKYKVEIGNGWIATAEASAMSKAFTIQHITSSTALSATALVSGVTTMSGAAVNSAVCVGTANAIKELMPTVLASANATYSQVHRGVHATYQGATDTIGSCLSNVTGIRIIPVTATMVSSATGTCEGVLMKLAQVNASAAVSVTMLAFSNYGVPAPDSRTMIIPNEMRIMVVPYDDRIMRKAA